MEVGTIDKQKSEQEERVRQSEMVSAVLAPFEGNEISFLVRKCLTREDARDPGYDRRDRIRSHCRRDS